jgi:hypothetical protein
MNANTPAQPSYRQHGYGSGGKTREKLELGFVLTLGQQTLKPFPTSLSLRVVRVLDLDPGKRIRAGLGFADDALQVLLAHQFKESPPVAFQVVYVQQVRIIRWNQAA